LSFLHVFVLRVLSPVRRRQWIADRLKQYSEDQITYGDFRKPRFENSAVQFNISHSRDLAALAVSDQTVGIDIEHLRAACSGGPFSELYPDEPSKLVRWTQLEAWNKWRGTGFSQGIDTGFFPEPLTYKRSDRPFLASHRWKDVVFLGAWIGAESYLTVATREPVPRDEIVWRWEACA
jgi:phosphopantetheinyl transferase